MEPFLVEARAEGIDAGLLRQNPRKSAGCRVALGIQNHQMRPQGKVVTSRVGASCSVVVCPGSPERIRRT